MVGVWFDFSWVCLLLLRVLCLCVCVCYFVFFDLRGLLLDLMLDAVLGLGYL